MKKLICWLLVIAIMLTAAGCKKREENTEPETIPTETTTEATTTAAA